MKKKNMNTNSQDDNSKSGSSYSTGTRGESAGARNNSGNRSGNRK